MAVAARALGVVTRADLTDYQRLGSFGASKVPGGISVTDAALSAGLTPVALARDGGPPLPAWADPAALAAAAGPGQGAARRGGRHRVTLLSPFDSLIWDRKRTLRMFGFEHSLEAYLPSAKRVHGYFTMPLLAGGALVGRVDPARDGRTLVARQLSLQSAAAARPMARALREAATWVGCDNVTVGAVAPARLAPADARRDRRRDAEPAS